MKNNIEVLIAKYCSDKLSNDEMKILMKWIESGKNKKVFKEYINLNYTIEELKNENFDDLILWNNIESEIRISKNKYTYWKYAVAASLLLTMALTFLLIKNYGDENAKTIKTVSENYSIKPGRDKATLTLGNGSIIPLEKGANYQSKNSHSNGQEIVYKKDEKIVQIEYNYLTIPRGGQFHIVLSDKTKVWLNSESQLKYPVSFMKGKVRQVELVYGEAYFDVSPSSKNNGTKFKVLNESQEVEVLGTEFNVKAYKDETKIFTTLIEGKVVVNSLGQNHNLIPNQQSTLNINTGKITIENVDVYNEISWKNGVFSFEEESLEEIMKVLSRWYDMEVVFQNDKVKNTEFFGVLRKDQDIEKILLTIKDYGIIKDYKLENNILILE